MTLEQRVDDEHLVREELTPSGLLAFFECQKTDSGLKIKAGAEMRFCPYCGNEMIHD